MADDDRLGDLGPDRRSAADRFSDLDERDARKTEADAAGKTTEPADPRGFGRRYTWVVGVVALIVIAVAAITSLPNEGRGTRGPEMGAPLPDFAAPAPDGTSDADANIAQVAVPDNDISAACDVRGPGIVTVCGAREGATVVVFVATGCEDALDPFSALADDFPDVRFVAVYGGDERAAVAEIAATHEWDGIEIAVDPDTPEIFSVYRWADCPTTTFTDREGRVTSTVNGRLTEAQLRQRLEASFGDPSVGR